MDAYCRLEDVVTIASLWPGDLINMSLDKISQNNF